MSMRLQRAPRSTVVNRRTRAFTLVEILIVVIILGILATIIIGLFQNGSRDAAAASLKDNLRNIRSQLQLYVAQHGTYPSLTNFEQQMTQYTHADGNISAMARLLGEVGRGASRDPSGTVRAMLRRHRLV